ncbi:hypothetical protein B0H17DRAFT_1332797 [Mycena rosella]|uniref:Uncharacterized protein n=1 Tax=Mycena rosella TaxID=1033263 RepID=A0AAD7GG79_MYCRO|nr:hypothetical protein B0H17DRAFT_1332797 [Mycena rosella]
MISEAIFSFPPICADYCSTDELDINSTRLLLYAAPFYISTTPIERRSRPGKAWIATSRIQDVQARFDNFALMIGFTNDETHLVYCQNKGKSDDLVKNHLEAIWRLLRKIQKAENIANSTTDPSQPSAVVWEELFSLCYNYVASKALHRARKRLDCFSALALAPALASLPDDSFETQLIKLMAVVSHSAAEAAKLTSSVDALLASEHWEVFRFASHELQNLASAGNGDARLLRLQAEAQSLPLHLQRDLIVHTAPLPSKPPITILLESVKMDLFSENLDLEEIKGAMRAAAGPSSTTEKIVTQPKCTQSASSWHGWHKTSTTLLQV